MSWLVSLLGIFISTHNSWGRTPNVECSRIHLAGRRILSMCHPFLSVEAKHILCPTRHTLGNTRLNQNVFLFQESTQVTVLSMMMPLFPHSSFMGAEQTYAILTAFQRLTSAFGFGLEGWCDKDPTHHYSAENRESTLGGRLRRRRKLKTSREQVLLRAGETWLTSQEWAACTEWNGKESHGRLAHWCWAGW